METNKPSIISFDFKKNRIRISRSALNAIGNPEYVQILINPITKEVVIHKSIPEDHLAHRVKYTKIRNHSYELYSKSLITSIQEVCPTLQANRTYTLNNTAIRSGNLIVFSLKDAEKSLKEDKKDYA